MPAAVIRAGADASHPSGLFCYVTGSDGNTQIHLAQFDQGNAEVKFTRTLPTSVKPPICLKQSVVAVNAEGEIYKLDLKGELVIAAKPAGFSGTARQVGKLTDTLIFVVETLWDSKSNGWLHHIYIIDVEGSQPVVKSKERIIEPFLITRTHDEIIVVGNEDVQRLKMP